MKKDLTVEDDTALHVGKVQYLGYGVVPIVHEMYITGIPRDIMDGTSQLATEEIDSIWSCIAETLGDKWVAEYECDLRASVSVKSTEDSYVDHEEWRS